MSDNDDKISWKTVAAVLVAISIGLGISFIAAQLFMALNSL